MKLIEITKDNIKYYKDFEKSFDDNLSKYLSRISPDSNTVIKWCYINVDTRNIGSVWLETVDKDIIKLGIFIAEEEYRNSGYGTAVIKEMLYYAKNNGYKSIILNVRTNNIQAYSLYKKLGFIEVKRYKKENGIDVISMEFEL